MTIADKLLSSDLTISEVLEIAGTLTFDPEKSITLTTTKNIILTGKLVMKPARPEVIHTIRFINVDESKFVGGGMDPIDSDVGLWVTGKGQLDIEGAPVRGWTRSKKAIAAGDTLLDLQDTAGWKAGHEIAVMPIAEGASNYDDRLITTVFSNGIGVAKTTAHPMVEKFGKQYYPEVANLTRNVRIEGTPSGKSHVLIHSTAVQNIKYAAFRYMGARKQQLGGAEKELVLGRYPLHFHHCEFGSKGSTVWGNVVRDSGNRAFVNHGSHGIHIKDNVAYIVLDDAYWWDLGHQTHDNLFESNLAAHLGYVGRSVDMALYDIDKSDQVPSTGVNGMLLGRGDGNIWRGNVVIGQSGDPHTYAAYLWPTRNEEQPEGVHVFEDNIAHNCDCGLRTWQNTGLPHVITRFTSFNNRLDLHHGAYQNNYEYVDCVFTGKAEFQAGSGDRLRIINTKFNQIEMTHSALPSDRPMLFLNCYFNTLINNVTEFTHNADVVHCEFGSIVVNSPIDTVRVQPKTEQAYAIRRSGRTNISPFAPTIWGTGTGLKGEYFSDANFQNKVLERLDINIAFGDWGNWVHYAVKGDTTVSVRWTGKLLAQFTEAHTFTTGGGGSMKTFINGTQVTKVNLVAGQLYDVKVEFTNNDNNIRGGANWKWNSPSLNLFSPGGEYVPQLQLYPGDTTPPPPPPNQKPTANAGVDAEITLPVNEYVLNGSGNDSDGSIVVYRWDKVEGGTAVIASPNLPVTKVTGLLAGTYLFNLKVTDDKGLSASDDVRVVVKPVPVNNLPPSADAGPDTEHTLSVPLSGTAVDVDGQIVGVKWEQVSGPQVSITNSDKNIASFIPGGVGVYVFKFSATDDKGSVMSDEKRVVVK